MIDTLTKVLRRPWPLPWRQPGAKLAGVNGFTGRGAIYYQNREKGAAKLSVELTGVAGREAEILADDETLAIITIAKGRGKATFISKRGDKVPDLSDGACINIRQNGDVILSGVLSRN